MYKLLRIKHTATGIKHMVKHMRSNKYIIGNTTSNRVGDYTNSVIVDSKGSLNYIIRLWINIV